tara:strand:+ start:391 stop:540 length:150 start_codon:yes stop_codon:yes gene_type:complete
MTKLEELGAAWDAAYDAYVAANYADPDLDAAEEDAWTAYQDELNKEQST